jgi:hypothetical protein
LSRRRFDHLARGVSAAVGGAVGRYALWLHLHDLGIDPERLDDGEALAFCRGPARRFVESQGLSLSRRAERRLRRAVDAYDPERLTPEELADGWEQEG